MPSYEQTIEWLFEQFPAYQKIGASAYKPTLENTKMLLKALHYPEKKLRFIHLAGTNGKGSSSHLIASIFKENGYKVGLFTSPHLLDFRERIKVDGTLIEKDFVLAFCQRIQKLQLAFSASFFEISFCMALCYFEKNNCEICVIETGLGGRLDATNVIRPELSVITNIGLDHQQFLGNTRKEIAAEKAGIIKANTPVLIGEKDEETKLVFETKAKQEKSPLYWVDFTRKFPSSLQGKYQEKNISTAYSAAKILQNILSLDEEKIILGIANVQKNFPLLGRMQLLSQNPLFIIDAAHNKEGVLELLSSVHDLNFDKLHLIYGAASDKNSSEIIQLFPKNAILYFSQFKNKRSSSLDTLKENAKDLVNEMYFFNSSSAAYEAAKKNSSQNDLILAFGSFFLIEEFL